MELKLSYLFTISGWIFVLYLSNRALKRADIARVKDSCISILEDSVKKIIELSEVKKLREINVESHMVHFATKASFRIKALNSLAKYQLVSSDDIDLVLRTAEAHKIVNQDVQYCQQLTSELLNYCDKIEQEYQRVFFQRSFESFYLRHHHELKGLALGFSICASLFFLFSYF